MAAMQRAFSLFVPIHVLPTEMVSIFPQYQYTCRSIWNIRKCHGKLRLDCIINDSCKMILCYKNTGIFRVMHISYDMSSSWLLNGYEI